MENETITYGNVSFEVVQVGSIVKVIDYDNRVAVGVVEEKKETIQNKSVGVRFGFGDEDITYVIIEQKQTKGQPMYTLLEIVRSYV